VNINDSVLSNTLFNPYVGEGKRAGTPVNPCVVGCYEVLTSRWAPKAHQMLETQQRHCVRTSVAELLVLEQICGTLFPVLLYSRSRHDDFEFNVIA